MFCVTSVCEPVSVRNAAGGSREGGEKAERRGGSSIGRRRGDGAILRRRLLAVVLVAPSVALASARPKPNFHRANDRKLGGEIQGVESVDTISSLRRSAGFREKPHSSVDAKGCVAPTALDAGGGFFPALTGWANLWRASGAGQARSKGRSRSLVGQKAASLGMTIKSRKKSATREDMSKSLGSKDTFLRQGKPELH